MRFHQINLYIEITNNSMSLYGFAPVYQRGVNFLQIRRSFDHFTGASLHIFVSVRYDASPIKTILRAFAKIIYDVDGRVLL
jgi:hypothetical protein